ncbi:MAG: hypothetical protein DI536_35115 [Archangium gephyra]|uniref:Uncharacterized protein n=1 Tax=Archangium gephyra TaxID=48 RepID=A0A2W5ST01_9BACT|nr:MAG: hypothetical protein DI536_35115 [Archangium gephyra]
MLGIRFEIERHARDEHVSAPLERTSSLRPCHEVLEHRSSEPKIAKNVQERALRPPSSSAR